MIYREEVQNLFTVPEEYCLCQCISADFKMGKGIALGFNQHYNMKNRLTMKYPCYLQTWDEMGGLGDCLYDNCVFNLITKRNYWEKPTYQTITTALQKMHHMIVYAGITKLAMPKIGCGLDRLNWDKVREIVQDIFKDTDVEILVCMQ